MEGLNQTASVIATFSQIAISLTAIIGLLSLVFKPVRNFIAWLFKRVNGNKDKSKEILDRIDNVENTLSQKVDSVRDELSKRIDEVSDRNDDNEKDRIRWEILDFANSCRNGRRHTKDEYEHIFRMNDKYTKLLKEGELNSYFEAEYDYIKHLHAERQEKNDFL